MKCPVSLPSAARRRVRPSRSGAATTFIVVAAGLGLSVGPTDRILRDLDPARLSSFGHAAAPRDAIARPAETGLMPPASARRGLRRLRPGR